jgi:SAM-dependent methyltransferase
VNVTGRKKGHLRRPEQVIPAADWTIITETPGLPVSREQLSMFMTRYHRLREYARDGAVLEVACGPGIGLPYLAETASLVIGGDIERRNLEIARDNIGDASGIRLVRLDAEALPFRDQTFSLVAILDSIYWLQEPRRFLDEARRVLRPEGRIFITTVNPEWTGFNPHPLAHHYFGARDLRDALIQSGFDPSLAVAFPDIPTTALDHTIAAVRKAAIRLQLIPKVNRRKAWLKRLFYGPLGLMPPQLVEGLAPVAPILNCPDWIVPGDYKLLYCTARLGSTDA